MKQIVILFSSLFALSAWGQENLETALKLASSEQYEEAEKVFDNLLKTDASNGDLYYYYGETIIKDYLSDTFSNSLEEYARKAENLFKQGLEKAPANPLNHVGMGAVTLLRTSDTTKAIPYFQQAEATIPVKPKKKDLTASNATLLTKLGLAQTYGSEFRFKKAVAYLEQAKIFNPDDPNIYLTLGDVYIKVNDASKGLFNYNQALNKDPNTPLPKIKIGNIYMRVPNLNAARPYFEEALEIDPDFAPVYRSLGELYTKAGRYDLAKENYQKFIELSGNNTPAKVRYANSLFQTRDYKGALEVIEEVLKVDNSRNYLNRLAAYSCYEMKPQSLEKGLTFIETFLKNASEESVFYKDYVYYGRILFKLANGDSVKLNKSFEQSEKALALNNDDISLISEMAVNYYYNQRYTDAIRMFELKKEKGKEGKGDELLIGKSYYSMNNNENALRIFNDILSKEPGNLEAQAYVARTYSKMDPSSEKGLAVPHFQKLLDMISSDIKGNMQYAQEVYSYMAYENYVTGNNRASKEWCDKLVNLDPGNKDWQLKAWTFYVLNYTEEKNWIEARNAWYKIQQLNPNNKDAAKNIEDLTKMINMERNMREN